MTFGAGITVTVQRQVEDRFGNYTTSTEIPVGPCGIDFTGSTEPSDNPQDTVTRNAVLFAPPGCDIQSPDRVLLPDGSRWSVVGNVADFTSPWSGWNPGLTVRLERVTG